MKPSIETLRTEIPELDERLLHDHLTRLGDDYFKRFSLEDIEDHLRAISRLSPENPVEFMLKQKRDNSVECTVLAFDYPSEFSLITGILAGAGFHVISGDVYTYRRLNKNAKKGIRDFANRRRAFLGDVRRRRKIIDFFSGTLAYPMPLKKWSDEFAKDLKEIIIRLERGDAESVDEAKNSVNEMVVRHLASLNPESAPVLYPVEMEVDNKAGPFTRLRVVSEDTPAFLYSLSNALSFCDTVIEHVRIRTIHGRVEDRIDLVDSRGRKVEEVDRLNKIKLSVLLVKQFTYFLAKAPDPYAAISRFEKIVNEIMDQPLKEKWISYMADRENLQDLARLLGASDFLWEDFIRLQYESLLPLFGPEPRGPMSNRTSRSMSERLAGALEKAHSHEERKEALNRFKDNEIFFIDLDHILNPDRGFHPFEERLTSLAELVVNAATDSIYNHLVERHGSPRSVGGLNTRYAVFGLGKLGGGALGYASDIELLFVYSDNGRTDGDPSIENSEFFNLLARGVNRFIETKREGIFQVDLRLRPYGDSGPLACSMESFCRYYGKDGNAHSYERLSLVRMRFIGGDPDFGSQLERIRDEIIYFSKNIDLKELRELREKQVREKNIQGKINAKFSPGGLVDLEYGVQVLQVMHGKEIPALRTARIHEALNALGDAGILSEGDSLRLIDAYDFLRNLINGLRMLRGSAKDLFLPSPETNEFGHLARRMGYVRGGPIDSAQRLYMDFETHTAVVRVLLEKYFGRESLVSHETGTVVDVILSDEMSTESIHRILKESGFRDTRRAYVNLKGLAGEGSRRETFARVALLVLDIIKRLPDRDRALNNWDRYIRSLASPEFHYHILLSQPMRMEILLNLFSSSQFLSDTLVRNPGFFEWLISPEVLHSVRERDEIERELRKSADSCSGRMEWLNKLRRFRRREILRIGTRDICLNVSTGTIMHELSALSEACTQVVLEERQKRNRKDAIHGSDGRFCIMALGKLGGNELNYSSDIDLIGIFTGPSATGRRENGYRETYTKIMEGVISDLSSHTEEGYAYRVDVRLRPYGRSGELVQTMSSLLDYYEKSASLWEIQAALKLRPIAGDIQLGHELLDLLDPIIYKLRNPEKITGTIEKMRDTAIRFLSATPVHRINVKSGAGGIRDIEFLVQGLQLIHGPHDPSLKGSNTLLAMDALAESAIIPREEAFLLKEDYLFLRRTEHYLQILEDQQVHSLPGEERELTALAKRMLGVEESAERFMDRLNGCLERVRKAYQLHLLGSGS